MTVLDGVLFGFGRHVVLPVLLFVGALVSLWMFAVFCGMWQAAQEMWWKHKGVKCGATHRRYPTCDRHRGHAGSHAGPWVKGSISRSRLRWRVFNHGESSYLEVDDTPRPTDTEEEKGS